MPRFAQPFLFRICMFCAFSRPRYQVTVYRTIGPLVCNQLSKYNVNEYSKSRS